MELGCKQRRRPGRHSGRQPGSRGLDADRRGAIAVEFALVLPVLILFLLGIVQIGSAYFLQNSMLNTARELARRLATAQVTAADAESWALERLPTLSRSYVVDVTPPQPGTPDGDTFRVVISMPLRDAVLVDPLGLFTEGNLQAEVMTGVPE